LRRTATLTRENKKNAEENKSDIVLDLKTYFYIDYNDDQYKNDSDLGS
jgi:hypothetical protein